MTSNKVGSTKQLVLASLFTALIVVGTFIRIPIPVVPFTLQFLFTNLAALLLGGRRGSVSVLVYMLLGLIGLPVFTGGGGIGYIFQPTFGYIMGFVVGAYAAGKIVERSKEKSTKTMLIAGFVNLGIVYAIGMVYYYCIANYYANAPIGVGALILYCFLLAVPGDIVLCFISAGLGKRLRLLLNL